MASSPIVMSSAEEWATYKAATNRPAGDNEQITTLRQQLKQARLQQQQQATLDSALALRQEDEQHLAEAHTLLERAASLLVNDDSDFTAWLNDYAAFAAKYPEKRARRGVI